MASSWVKTGEELCDLQHDGLRILQRKDAFRFGTDAVLLSHFVKTHPGEHMADFGTGTAVIPLLVVSRTRGMTCDAFEIQPEMADMAQRSIALNDLSDRIHVHSMDCRKAETVTGRGLVDLVTMNPPYTADGAGLVSPNPRVATARNAEGMSLGEWFSSASRILRGNGRLALIYPAPQFLQVADALRSAHLEPKTVRFVAGKVSARPKLVMIEASKCAKPGLHFLPILFTHTEEGTFTQEMRQILGEAE